MVAVAFLALACVHVKASVDHGSDATSNTVGSEFAHIYYWKAKPGKLDEYNRYIRELAEPIDREAQRMGAFVSVTTYVSADTLAPWTHMRVFILKDSAQLAGLGDALTAAGARLEPDSVKRRIRGEYSATLRDRVGDAVVTLLR
jgi:hypothetical protein